MIRIEFKNRWQDLSIFRNRKAQILASVFTKTSELMIRLQAHIVQTKLSGNPLHRVTGILASSVQAQPTRVEGDKIIGEVQAATGPAWYGVVHELGGERSYDILPSRKRVLRFMRNGEEIFARIVHHPPLPERSFMRSSEAEMKEVLVSEMQRALDDGIKEP